MYYHHLTAAIANEGVAFKPTNSLEKEFEQIKSILSDFQFQAVCLSIPEIKLLVDIVIQNEQTFLGRGMKIVVNMAKRIRRASEEDGLFEPMQNEEVQNAMFVEHPIKYLLFIEQNLPNEMEQNYAYRIHRSKTILRVKNTERDTSE
jgi:hypothetical protein